MFGDCSLKNSQLYYGPWRILVGERVGPLAAKSRFDGIHNDSINDQGEAITSEMSRGRIAIKT